MKKAFYIFIFISTSILMIGQTDDYKNNSAYGELLGNGGSWASVNYERIIHYKKSTIIHNTFRVGFSFSTNRWDKTSMYNFPFEINTLVGKSGHFVEFGLGWTMFLGTSNLNDTLIPKEHRSNFSDTYFIRLGYRYMNESFVLRVSPLLGYVKDNIYSTKRTCILGLGISAGGCFNFRRSKDINDAYGG